MTRMAMAYFDQGKPNTIVITETGQEIPVTEYSLGDCRFCGREASYFIQDGSERSRAPIGILHGKPPCVVFDAMDGFDYIAAHIGAGGLALAQQRAATAVGKAR